MGPICPVLVTSDIRTYGRSRDKGILSLVNMSTGIKVQYIKRATLEIGKVDHIALKQKALRLTIWPVVDTANNSGL